MDRIQYKYKVYIKTRLKNMVKYIIKYKLKLETISEKRRRMNEHDYEDNE